MTKIYGDEVRQRSGIEQALLERMPTKLVEEVRKLSGSARSLVGANARVLKEAAEPLEQLVDKGEPGFLVGRHCRPRFLTFLPKKKLLCESCGPDGFV